MKSGLYLIFKCRNCGHIFEEKDSKGVCSDKNHIGRKIHSIASTHRCNKESRGCAELIGCKDYDTK